MTLNQYHKSVSFSSSLQTNEVLAARPKIAAGVSLPVGYNAYLLKNIYIVKLLVARSYRALRMAKRMPVHGQRRWSNANTVKRCNLFLWRAVMAYERDLFHYKKRRVFKWSKVWEMREKAKMRKKTKKKKWTKFKKFGERRLAVKKKKKTPWD